MAKVYVGTYGKYNSGSLAGRWIDLDQCANYGEFLAKCKEAHKGERDPEYMIQDCEGMPDGLSCMEWISEADFNDIKSAMQEDAGSAFTIVDYSDKAIAVTGDTRPLAESFKAIGGRFNPRLSCGAGWIFPKTKAQAVRAILAGSPTTEGEKPKADGYGAKYAECVNEWMNEMNEADKWKDYHRKESAAAVKLPEGYFVIEKPRIENKFCFHDEGPQYELYKSLMADEKRLEKYFLNQNLSDFDTQLKWLADKDNAIYVQHHDYHNTAQIMTRQYMWDYDSARREGCRAITDKERLELHDAVRYVRDCFEKRLHAYLKRYGVSKLHTWTYWADA